MLNHQNIAKKKADAYLERGTARLVEADGKHIYYDGDSAPLPSISKILSVFAFNEYLEINPDILEEAAMIGKAVHAYAEATILGHTYEADSMVAEDVRYQNCVRAFTSWKKDKELIPLLIEQPLVSARLGFGGTPDFIGYVNGKLSVYDHKTGAIQFKNFIQLELLAHLLWNIVGIKVRRLVLLELNKITGEFKERSSPDRYKSREYAMRVLRFYRQTENFKKIVDGRRRIII